MHIKHIDNNLGIIKISKTKEVLFVQTFILNTLSICSVLHSVLGVFLFEQLFTIIIFNATIWNISQSITKHT